MVSVLSARNEEDLASMLGLGEKAVVARATYHTLKENETEVAGQDTFERVDDWVKAEDND